MNDVLQAKTTAMLTVRLLDGALRDVMLYCMLGYREEMVGYRVGSNVIQTSTTFGGLELKHKTC